MISSLMESIGGLVTCANFCLKKSKSGGSISERGGTGTSIPIEAVASMPFKHIGIRVFVRLP